MKIEGDGVTWSEVRNLITLGGIFATIIFSWAQLGSRMDLMNQKLDTLTAKQNVLDAKQSDLSDAQIAMAKELVRLDTIIDSNQKNGKLSDSQRSVLALAAPTPTISPQIASLPVTLNYSPVQTSAQPTPQAVTPTPQQPMPTPMKQTIQDIITPIIKPILNALN